MKKTFTFCSLLCSLVAAHAQQYLDTWGDNMYGRLGTGTKTSFNTPQQIGTANWIVADGGEFFSAGIQSDGSLWTWGNDSDGQLGTGVTVGTADGELSPVHIGTDTDWKTLSAGSGFTLAIKTNGSLWGWGDNTDLALGTGSSADVYVPTQIGAATDWKSVSAGDAHTLALKTDGSLWAWGDNNFGKLGRGGTVDASTPVQIGTATDWIMISAGQECSFAIKADGSLWAWGKSTTGGANADAPAQLGTATDWKFITSANNSHFAIKTDGTLWAWGNNFVGQLGIGSSTSPTTPTQVGTDKDWASVANGYMHAVALKNDHTIWGMGAGNASAVSSPLGSNVPVKIGTANTWTAIASGNSHVLAIGSTGATSVTENSSNAIVGLYPNPARASVHIQAPATALSISIRNIAGQLVYHGTETDIPVAAYQPGIYSLCIIFRDGTSTTEKLIIE